MNLLFAENSVNLNLQMICQRQKAYLLTILLDVEEYLPPATLQWCNTQIKSIGYDPHSATCQNADEQGERPYKSAYLRLRVFIHEHIASGALPLLSETIHPLGSSHWLKEREARGRELLELDSVDEELPFFLSNDGPDPGMIDDDYDEELEST
jgi:hypothetical protein